MSLTTIRSWSPVALVLITLMLGCGPNNRSPLGSVQGTVTLDGNPIPDGSIIFEVDGARPATGKIVNGQIQDVFTYEPGDGVPVGFAKIAVFADQPAGAAPSNPGGADSTNASPEAAATQEGYMGGEQKSLVPKSYNNPATSGLTAKIESGENKIELSLSSE